VELIKQGTDEKGKFYCKEEDVYLPSVQIAQTHQQTTKWKIAR
jgi:hypothetical protein